jgi:hypothetical protein
VVNNQIKEKVSCDLKELGTSLAFEVLFGKIEKT